MLIMGEDSLELQEQYPRNKGVEEDEFQSDAGFTLVLDKDQFFKE
jgi:hypothetical protein